MGGHLANSRPPRSTGELLAPCSTAPEYFLQGGQETGYFRAGRDRLSNAAGRTPYGTQVAKASTRHRAAPLAHRLVLKNAIPVWIDGTCARRFGEPRARTLSEFIYDPGHSNERFLHQNRGTIQSTAVASRPFILILSCPLIPFRTSIQLSIVARLAPGLKLKRRDRNPSITARLSPASPGKPSLPRLGWRR